MSSIVGLDTKKQDVVRERHYINRRDDKGQGSKRKRKRQNKPYYGR